MCDISNLIVICNLGTPFKNTCHLCPTVERFVEYYCKGCQVISLSGVRMCVWPALHVKDLAALHSNARFTWRLFAVQIIFLCDKIASETVLCLYFHFFRNGCWCILSHTVVPKRSPNYIKLFDGLHPSVLSSIYSIYILPLEMTVLLYSTMYATYFGLYDLF